MKNKIDKEENEQKWSLQWLFVLLMLLICCSGCLDKVEGCLDNAASNYNASTDTPCEDCCTYPTLKIEIAHRIRDSLPLAYGQRYEWDGIDSFQVNLIKFYLSEFHLENDASSEGVIDTVQFDLQDGTKVTLEDNFQLISRAAFSYGIGELRATGTFNRIAFYVGLTEVPNQAVPGSVTKTNHPLAIQSDSLYPDDNNAYIFNRISLVPPMMEDTVVYDIQSDQLVKVVLDYDLTIDLGFEAVIPLKIDYLEWFKGIDFAADPAVIKEAIVSNTAKAFSINEQ